MDIYQEISNYSRNDNLNYVFCDLVNTPLLDSIKELFNKFSYCPWIFSLIGSILVGLSGVFPLLVIPIEEGENLKFGGILPWEVVIFCAKFCKDSTVPIPILRMLFGSWNGIAGRKHRHPTAFVVNREDDGANRLRVLLSFAVGGLLGDVFLHLLPEAWELNSDNNSHPSLFSGLWVLTGMMVFVIVEKLSSSLETDEKPNALVDLPQQGKANGTVVHACDQDKQIHQNSTKEVSHSPDYINNNSLKCVKEKSEEKKHYHISGYLNLMANSVDNFLHGLAIGGSFSISFKMGVLSTFAILVHELPHEVGDFAILLKSGFSRWDAAKAQLCTAFAGIVGAMIHVLFESTDGIEAKTSWILPFTAGGFLHIALVTVLPELVHEESKFESCKQLGSLVFGITVMAFMITVVE